jgi:leucyl/phenylalanyl-tRNA--protein transferase
VPPTWAFPDPVDAAGDLVAIGGDLQPETLLSAYRSGYFPMPLDEAGRLGWFSPNPRAILPSAGFHVSRSLRRSSRRFRVSFNTDFAAVVAGCADPRRPHGWITPRFRDAYLRLHELGWAHSVEVWIDDRLVGGLYGVAIGGLFAAESMFHTATDASKVAMWAMVRNLAPTALIDVQWSTPHLASLGVVEVPRIEYLRRLRGAIEVPAQIDW